MIAVAPRIYQQTCTWSIYNPLPTRISVSTPRSTSGLPTCPTSTKYLHPRFSLIMTAYYCAASFHTGLHPSQISTYSSLAGALTPVSPPTLFTSPSRRRVPQTACKKVSSPAFEPIAFDYFEQARQGVALRDFTVKSQTGINQILSGANEPVLATAGIHKLDLRIMVSLRYFLFQTTGV